MIDAVICLCLSGFEMREEMLVIDAPVRLYLSVCGMRVVFLER